MFSATALPEDNLQQRPSGRATESSNANSATGGGPALAEGESDSEASLSTESGFDDPEIVKRRCTDPIWLFVLPVCVALLIYLGSRELQASKLFHYNHPTNWRTEICGEGDLTSTPYLFYCLNNTRDGDERVLDIDHRVCIASCPNASDDTVPECPAQDQPLIQVGLMPTAPHSAGYTAALFLEIFCLPMDLKLWNQVPFKKWRTTPMAYVEVMVQNWRAFCSAIMLALVLSFTILLVLRRYVALIVWGGICLPIVVPAVLAVYLHICGMQECHGPDHIWLDRAITFVLIIVIICMLRWVCLNRDSIHSAIIDIQWALGGIFRMPSVLAVPVLVVPSRAALIFLFRGALLRLLIVMYPHIVTVRGTTLSLIEALCLVYFIFMLFWLQFCVSAVADFVVIYSTAVVFHRLGFSSDARSLPTCLVARAYARAFLHHFGTIIHGGLFVGFARPFRTLARLFSHCPMCPEAVTAPLAHTKKFSAGAYCEVALHGTSFLEAASRAEEILELDGDQVKIVVLRSALRIFEFAIAGGVGCIGFMTTTCYVRHHTNIGRFSSAHIYDPTVFTILGGIVAALISTPLAALLRNVSETILYCETVEKGREESEHVEAQYRSTFHFDTVAYYAREGLSCYCGYRPKYSQQTDAEDAAAYPTSPYEEDGPDCPRATDGSPT